MPKHIAYRRSGLRWADLQGHLVSIPELPSITWRVMPGSVYRNRVHLVSNNGIKSEAHCSTLIRWIEDGKVRLSA